MKQPIATRHVRYIKLGEGGIWAPECLRDRTMRVGFWTHKYFDLCSSGQWAALARAYESEERLAKSTVTRFVNVVRTVYEDHDEILWVTFENQMLYWTFIDPGTEPWRAPASEEGSYRQVLHRYWRSPAAHGQAFGTCVLDESRALIVSTVDVNSRLPAPGGKMSVSSAKKQKISRAMK